MYVCVHTQTHAYIGPWHIDTKRELRVGSKSQLDLFTVSEHLFQLLKQTYTWSHCSCFPVYIL